MEVETNNTYTTSVMPSFTFIVDGPDTCKHNQDSKSSLSITSTTTTNNTIINNNKGLNTQISSLKTVPPGPLHIITSWQPSDPKDKPPYSYATLIAHAILSSEHRRLTLSEIYKWITIRYPYYTMQEHGWQNSIRHNLSLNKGFVRIQRSSIQNKNNTNSNNNNSNTGRGNYWTIRIGYEQPFIDNLIKRRGPINKQPVSLPRSLQRRRSSISSASTYNRINNNDHHGDNESLSSISSSIYPTTTTTNSGNNSPLFATFRMTMPTSTSNKTNNNNNNNNNNSGSSSLERFTKRKKSMPELHHHLHHHQILQQRRRSTIAIPKIKEEEFDSDCDSGIDVGQDFLLSHMKMENGIKKSKSISCFSDHPSSTFIESSLSTPILHYQNNNNNNNDNNNNDNNNNMIMNTTTSTPLLQHMKLNDYDLLSSTSINNWYNNNNNNNHLLFNYCESNNNYINVNNNNNNMFNLSNLDLSNQFPASPTIYDISSSPIHLSFVDHLYNNDNYLFQNRDLLNDWII